MINFITINFKYSVINRIANTKQIALLKNIKEII